MDQLKLNEITNCLCFEQSESLSRFHSHINKFYSILLLLATILTKINSNQKCIEERS